MIFAYGAYFLQPRKYVKDILAKSKYQQIKMSHYISQSDMTGSLHLYPVELFASSLEAGMPVCDTT